MIFLCNLVLALSSVYSKIQALSSVSSLPSHVIFSRLAGWSPCAQIQFVDVCVDFLFVPSLLTVVFNMNHHDEGVALLVHFRPPDAVLLLGIRKHPQAQANNIASCPPRQRERFGNAGNVERHHLHVSLLALQWPSPLATSSTASPSHGCCRNIRRQCLSSCSARRTHDVERCGNRCRNGVVLAVPL